MLEVDINLTPHLVRAALPELVEAACLAEGLTLTLRTTLAACPGCIHWHYKRGNERGTLEITWWERRDRLWCKVARGRSGAWVEPAIGRLKAQLESTE